MKTVINVHDLKTNYSKYLGQAMDGKEILLGKHGKAVAKIVALPDTTKQTRKLGKLEGKISMSEDFNEPMMDLWDTITNR